MNATNGSIQSLIMPISPMLSGALLTMASIETIFFIDVIAAVIGISTLFLFLHILAHAKANEKETDRPVLGYINGDRYSLAVDAGNSRKHVEKFYREF